MDIVFTLNTNLIKSSEVLTQNIFPFSVQVNLQIYTYIGMVVQRSNLVVCSFFCNHGPPTSFLWEKNNEIKQSHESVRRH